MDETYNIKAIILKSEPFREADSRITVFSFEKGKMELVARGAKKIKSKIAGQIVPLSAANIMVVRGRNYDYAGSAVCANYFKNIKNSFEKLEAVGEAVNIFNKLIKNGERDEKLFWLLFGYLAFININEARTENLELEKDFFVIKLLGLMGYGPELFKCLNCGEKIKPDGNIFSFKKGGVICGKCKKLNPPTPLQSGGQAFIKGAESLTISENCIKVLRLVIEKDFSILIKLKINKGLAEEVKKTISSFLNYHHNI